MMKLFITKQYDQAEKKANDYKAKHPLASFTELITVKMQRNGRRIVKWFLWMKDEEKER